MKYRELYESEGLRTFVIIFDAGDEVMSGLKQCAESLNLTGASLVGIGALSSAVLAYFDWETKEYRKNPVEEQVEVAALNGDIAVSPDDTPAVHIHLVLGRRDGSAVAGHLVEGHVRPTLELVVTETPAYLQKVADAETGLAFIRP